MVYQNLSFLIFLIELRWEYMLNKINRKEFKTRGSLCSPKNKEPSEETKRNSERLIEFKREGTYFIAVLAEEKSFKWKYWLQLKESVFAWNFLENLR